ncbi:Uncharacterised protein [Klebsiella pneumoniae]|uniref:Uncharacterized protein n=1 Tax=Klebsiella pneumoniae TaxID=573 RepID=A0A2X3CTF3_KLEPN|nr:Uncharacterised protein [Klebsiella pneumoniae]
MTICKQSHRYNTLSSAYLTIKVARAATNVVDALTIRGIAQVWLVQVRFG